MRASIDNRTTARPRRLRLRGRRRVRTGLSLIELIVVLAVLIAVAGVAVVNYAPVASKAQDEATRAALRELRDVFVGNAAGPGYLSDVGRAYDDPTLPTEDAQRAYRESMTFLLVRPSNDPDPAAFVMKFSPVTKRGWRGPYLRDPPLDGWGKRIVFQVPAVPPAADELEAEQHARLVSGGPNGEIDTTDSWLGPDNPPVNDDIVLFVEPKP